MISWWRRSGVSESSRQKKLAERRRIGKLFDKPWTGLSRITTFDACTRAGRIAVEDSLRVSRPAEPTSEPRTPDCTNDRLRRLQAWWKATFVTRRARFVAPCS